MAGGKLLHHVSNLVTVERHQRNRAVMRTRAPGRPKLRPGSQQNEQRRQRAAFGDAAQNIECCRIGPMQVFQGQHDWLRARASHQPIGQRRQLPAAQFLGR